VLVSGLCLFACGATSRGARQSPSFASRISGIHTASLLAPEVNAFEISAGGVTERKEEWTNAARENVTNALIFNFQQLGITVQPLGEADPAEVEQVRALSQAVIDSVMHYGYDGQFPYKQQHFEYSLGSLSSLLDKASADALVVAWAQGYVPSAGREVLNLLVGGPPQQAHFAVAVVDRSGEVIWFNQTVGRGAAVDGSNLSETGANALAKSALAGFMPQKR
jgi:hypothetical protein